MSLYEEQDRRQQFKTAFSPREARKRREEAWALLRSRKRGEALSRRRREEPSPPASPAVPEEMDWSREEAVCRADEPEADEEVISLEDLPCLADAMVDGGDEEQRQATASLRKLLARGEDPPIDAIDAVVAAGLLPPLIRLLSATNATVQYEAAWALTNVASGTPAHTEAMLASGAVAALVALLKSPSQRLQEQAAWALGNIAGDAAQGKLAVLAQAAIPLLVALGRTVTRGPLLRQVAWTLANLCRNTGPAEFEQLLPALPLLVQWMGHPDSEVHTSACWAIAHLCDGPSEHVAAVLAANVVPRLAELLKSPKRSVQSPALHLMGNIVAGENRQTQFLINSGFLPFLHAFLAHPDKDLQKEACWALSNIAAGSQAQIQAILNANLIPPVLRLLGSADVGVRREAAWCVCNALAGGDAMQIVYLVQQGCLLPLCELLLSTDAKLVSMALEGLESILSVGQDQKPWTNGVNTFAQYMLETGCVDRLERLQSHPNTRVYEQATELLERFFAADHMQDSLMTPGRDTSCLYSDFASSSPPQFVLA